MIEKKCATIDELIKWLTYHRDSHGGDTEVMIATENGRVMSGSLISNLHGTYITTLVEVQTTTLKEIS